MAPVLEARQLAKTYETGGAKVLGLRGVDLSIERPRTMVVLIVVAATSLPARLATRIRIADALRYE